MIVGVDHDIQARVFVGHREQFVTSAVGIKQIGLEQRVVSNGFNRRAEPIERTLKVMDRFFDQAVVENIFQHFQRGISVIASFQIKRIALPRRGREGHARQSLSLSGHRKSEVVIAEEAIGQFAQFIDRGQLSVARGNCGGRALGIAACIRSLSSTSKLARQLTKLKFRKKADRPTYHQALRR